MHHCPRRSLASALFLLAVGVVAPIVQAAPKDAEAQKLDKQAMDEDYLNVQFDKAEEKLRKALNICGTSGCDSKVKAQIYMNLGIILVNAKKQADAVAAFSEGLKLDPSATPNQDFTSDEVKKAFESARGSASPPHTGSPAGTGNPPSAGGGETVNDLAHDPIPEAQVDYPIPIYVGPQEGAARFLLYYKAPGADFTKVELKKMGKGFGAEIPCKDVKIAGRIKYYIQALDAQGDIVGSAGSKKQPLEIELKQKIAGDLPAFPGKDPPAKCKGGADCPPGMNEEGCETKLSYGSKCTGPNQCSKADGLACIEGTCQPGKEEDDGDDGSGEDGPPKLNLLWGMISIDDAVVSGSDICSVENSVQGTYVCFRQDKQDDKGNPRLYRGKDVTEKGSISGPPFAIGTIRVLLGYDRAIPIKAALIPAVGVRLGYAFNGGPTVPNPTEGDKPFMPWHAEGRATLFFGRNVLSKRGVRPYAFVSGGLAQVDAKIANVPVSDDCINYDPAECPSTVDNKRPRIKVDAYRKMGTGFAALGGGMLYAVSKNSSIMV
ncbi:MAG: tetratricopeptide repeat protein, partial [Myxococcales bacterium]|nr:tetratricopeptide repeat protein [Myxococcales bacterium]